MTQRLILCELRRKLKKRVLEKVTGLPEEKVDEVNDCLFTKQLK